MINYFKQSITSRNHFVDVRHQGAFRLFNGFVEGWPEVVLDVYGSTLVIHNYGDPPEELGAQLDSVIDLVRRELPWIDAILLKERKGKTAEARNGRLLDGVAPVNRVREFGVWYALDLTMNRDASFYLDTRNLRKWLLENSADKSILNTFAYTGSLGVAATAGGAAHVIQTDLNKRFLNVAKTSHTLNGFPINKRDFHAGDFWSQINRYKREKLRFDTVLLDPPFFAQTKGGRVDLANNMGRLINKVRPIVKNGGKIIAINNALYVSGADYWRSLEALCHDGYVSLEKPIAVSADFTGTPATIVGKPVTDPAPFNHSTKIAVLSIRHKDTAQ